jgi:hypothetical protein
MTKGEKVYVVEKYLVEERTSSLLAGEVGLDVIFECQAWLSERCCSTSDPPPPYRSKR